MNSPCTKTATAITKTKHLQQTWGFEEPSEPKIDLKDLKGCYEQLADELDELLEIIEDIEELGGYYDVGHINELSDVYIDIMEYCQQGIVRSGLSERYGEDSHKIYLNNTTKVHETEKEAEETLDMYLDQGTVCYAIKNKWGQWVVRDSKTDKVMKPKGFVPVEL